MHYCSSKWYNSQKLLWHMSCATKGDITINKQTKVVKIGILIPVYVSKDYSSISHNIYNLNVQAQTHLCIFIIVSVNCSHRTWGHKYTVPQEVWTKAILWSYDAASPCS